MAKVDITNNEIDYILRRPIKSGKFFVMDETTGDLENIGRINPSNISRVDFKDPTVEGLDVIYEHIKEILEEQDRELLTEYLKDKYILVGSPLVKAMVENDERFKDCKVFYCKYADPNSLHIIRRFDLGMLEEG